MASKYSWLHSAFGLLCGCGLFAHRKTRSQFEDGEIDVLSESFSPNYGVGWTLEDEKQKMK